MLETNASSAPGEWPQENEFRALLRSILDDPNFERKHRYPPEKECLAIIDDRVVDFLTTALGEAPLEEAQTTLLKALRIIREFLGERLGITRFADRRTERLAFSENDVPLSGGERETPKYRKQVEKRVDAEAYIGRLKTLLLLRILGRKRLEKSIVESGGVSIDAERRAVHETIGAQVETPEKSSSPTSSVSAEDYSRRETILGSVRVKYEFNPAQPNEYRVYVHNRDGTVGTWCTFKSASAAVEGFYRICEVIGTFMETETDVGGSDDRLRQLIWERTADLRSETES